MKPYKISKYLLALVAAVSLVYACTDDFQELNTNPALLSEEQLDVGLLLTRVQQEMIINGSNPIGTLANYAGYASSGGNRPFDGGFFSDEFAKGYRNLLNISEIIRLTDGDAEMQGQNAIARVMRVYIFHRLTDLYGDIPYSEAVKASSEVITQPMYDTQESIYGSMLDELKELSSVLSETQQGSFGDSDMMYQSDNEKWMRFANSLRLRIALRVRYVDEALAREHISELVNMDLIESNEENAFVPSSDDFDSNQNPVYNRLISNSGILPEHMGQTIVDLLNDQDDPRLTILVTPTPNSVMVADSVGDSNLLEYRGRPLGLEGLERDAYPTSDLSQIGLYYREPVIEMPVLYYSEVCFALAEAKLMLDLGSLEADVWYERGVRADMERYGIDEAEIASFLSSNSLDVVADEEAKLEMIMNQKNIALFPNELEAWSEWRRTGYPKILIGSMVGETDGQIPRRINYPVSEANVNSVNYQEVSTRIGGDLMTTKVWWDANPNVPYEHPGEILVPEP
ncbi:SusD/RagB family nutrient-binding outer membrane lipoprotein [Pseudozobellia thermophila]|uniref:Starch-binding associating with outer membrane n=1 Tax=Pseudozobellia thermophila TaxID=192903 RepID=A0A1M6NLS7_9FLAO|nr:SusD/RagB family nutrient-binding outer membrane lipoprotein [Pseudozobellia thermophila]SHJ96698.1 Starch-binding associating with outer membrane [Pseudozobellia thermophila]